MKKIKKYFKTLFFLLGAIVIISCGIKGPPLPPINEETIQKQKAAEVLAKQQDEAAKAAASSSDSTKAKAKKKK